MSYRSALGHWFLNCNGDDRSSYLMRSCDYYMRLMYGEYLEICLEHKSTWVILADLII